MSPKKRQMCREVLSVVVPEAPNHTMKGKIQMMHTASNMPLRLIGEPPSMKGTWKSASNKTAHIQKAPRTFFIGLNTRDISMPIVSGQSIRSVPPRRLVVSIVQPTPIEP